MILSLYKGSQIGAKKIRDCQIGYSNGNTYIKASGLRQLYASINIAMIVTSLINMFGNKNAGQYQSGKQRYWREWYVCQNILNRVSLPFTTL